MVRQKISIEGQDLYLERCSNVLQISGMSSVVDTLVGQWSISI